MTNFSGLLGAILLLFEDVLCRASRLKVPSHNALHFGRILRTYRQSLFHALLLLVLELWPLRQFVRDRLNGLRHLLKGQSVLLSPDL